MKTYDVKQGSPEWVALRLGMPTASAFDALLTPSGEKSKQAEGYLHELLAERLSGESDTAFTSKWMERGIESEAEAVRYYEMQRGVDTVKVGFMTNDAGTIGASPDRLVGERGLLEIKVPKSSTHVYYLLKRGVDAKYYPQVMGQLWIAEREWLDILSYHPLMPAALVRVERDDVYIAKLAKVVGEFSELLEKKFQECRDKGWVAERKDRWRPAPANLGPKVEGTVEQLVASLAAKGIHPPKEWR